MKEDFAEWFLSNLSVGVSGQLYWDGPVLFYSDVKRGLIPTPRSSGSCSRTTDTTSGSRSD